MKKIYKRLLIVFILLTGVYGIGYWLVPEGSVSDRILGTIAYPMVVAKKKMSDVHEYINQMIIIHRNADQICTDFRKRYEDLRAQYLELVGTSTMWHGIEELALFKKRYKADFGLVVDVISKQFSPSEHFFLIEGGTNKGIQPDMVAVYKNCLVGRVSQVYERYSKVMLITDSQCKVSALCRISLDRGIHEGTGSLDATQLSYVFDTQMDLDKRLIKGDIVISSGEGLVFPRGFGLGTMIDYKKNDLHVDITIQPLLDFQKIDYCCIIAKGAELAERDFAGSPDTPHQKQPQPTTPVVEKKLEPAPQPVVAVAPTVLAPVVEKPEDLLAEGPLAEGSLEVVPVLGAEGESAPKEGAPAEGTAEPVPLVSVPPVPGTTSVDPAQQPAVPAIGSAAEAKLPDLSAALTESSTQLPASVSQEPA